MLESAIARPYQSFGGEIFYSDPFFKAAAIIESIIINHPFIDGNKRTGLLAMLFVLNDGNWGINISNDDLYSFIVRISTGEIKFEQIAEWLKANTIALK